MNPLKNRLSYMSFKKEFLFHILKIQMYSIDNVPKV